MKSILQNPHDHPLLLVFSGENVDRLVDHCRGIFSNSTFPLENHNALTIMQGVMPIHFSQRDKDYFIFCKFSEKKVFIALNHRFHDIQSVDLILKSTPYPEDQRALALDMVIKRRPNPAEQRVLYPMKMSTMKISRDLMDRLTNKFKLTVNECLFWLMCSTIASNYKEPQQVTCFHNIRKSIGKNKVPGGDYSCLVTPMLLEENLFLTEDSGIKRKVTWPIVDLVPTVKNYFQGVRENVLNWSEDEQEKSMKDIWIYNSWIGTDISHPPLFNDICLDLSSVLSILSVILDRFALASKWPNEWQLTIFAEGIEFPELYTHDLESILD